MLDEIVTAEELALWFKMQEQMKKVKDAEMVLRKRIFKYVFAMPTEGVNVAEPDISIPLGLSDGFILKGTYKLDRNIDESVLKSITPSLREMKINPDKLVNYKPSLAVTEYKKLTAEEMKFFDQCLIIKPGAPSLEIVIPKKK